jgi:2-hydroxychromene-2-carboxylate isomerase
MAAGLGGLGRQNNMTRMTGPSKSAPSEATWYFDIVSPFAYLALPAVEAVARRHSVRFCPVLLSALLSRWGQLGPAEVAPKRLCTYRLVQFTADRSGLRLRFPPRHPFRSLDALRLLAALDGRPDAVRATFDFVWAEGRDPSEPAEHAALCARLGVPDGRLQLPAAR